MHLCAELIAVSMMLEPLGEVGAIFSLQLSSRTQFTKINNKKVIAENQCEKHKKSSLVFSQTIGPIELKFYVKTPYDNLAKNYAKYFGHMAKMTATIIYDKNILKSSSPEPEVL